MTEIARKSIKEDLETVQGVGAVTLVGGQRRAVNVYIDTDKLAAYLLSAEDVRQALIRQNLELPGGRVDQGQQEMVLRTMGRLEKSSDFLDLIVANRNDQPIRIRDIGRVEDGVEEPRGLSRLDGENAVSLVVQKQSGLNTVEVVHAVKARLAKITPFLPADIKTVIIRDQSRFIEASIEEVKFHLLLAAVLVSLTILLFIRDWRTTIIATLAIPTSMVPTFAYMSYMGFSLNNITMLGLILAIGIVIDDAVVVHENIFRHMEEYGRPAMEASRSATAEIASAVVATTISLLVIFIPVAFMQGRIGRFFNSFGFTVGFAILMSMFVSFTMTPMLCSRFLVLDKGHSSSKSGFFSRMIDGTYLWMLRVSLRHRWAIVILAIATLFSTPVVFGWIGKDFVPKDDQSDFEVVMTLPEGYTLERGDKLLREIEGRLKQLRGVTHIFTIIGDTTGRVAKGQGDVTEARVYCRLVDLAERDYTQFDVMVDARELMSEYVDLRVAVQEVAAFQATGFRQVDVDLNLVGPIWSSCRSMPTRSSPGWRRAGITSTSTPVCRSASPNCGFGSTASGPRTWGSRSRRWRRLWASWSGASRSASTKRAMSSTTSGCGRKSRSAITRTRSIRCRSRPKAVGWSGSPASRGWSRRWGRPRSVATGGSGRSWSWRTSRGSRWARQSPMWGSSSRLSICLLATATSSLGGPSCWLSRTRTF